MSPKREKYFRKMKRSGSTKHNKEFQKVRKISQWDPGGSQDRVFHALILFEGIPRGGDREGLQKAFSI